VCYSHTMNSNPTPTRTATEWGSKARKAEGRSIRRADRAAAIAEALDELED